MGRLRRVERRGDGRLAELGDDPVPFPLDQPHARLRLSRLERRRHRRWCSASWSAATGAAIFVDAFDGVQLWGELFEVPLMSAMFLAMVWHARRRLVAMREAESLAASQERLMHDVSHELRTPVAIARGHLDLHRRRDGESPELAVVADELGRIDRLISRLLLLAQADQPAFLTRSTRGGDLPRGRLHALDRGRAEGLASRPARNRHRARRPRSGAHRARRAARERLEVHRASTT